MTREEYEKVKAYTYEEYCEYLDKKYCNIHKFAVHPEYNGVYLFKHHTLENKKANLSDPEIAKTATDEEKYSITLCDVAEHLFLHILIGEQTDPRKRLGLGGANYIVAVIEKRLNYNYYSGYSFKYLEKIDEDLFFILKERLWDAEEKRYQILLGLNIDNESEIKKEVVIQKENKKEDDYFKPLKIFWCVFASLILALFFIIGYVAQL